MTEIRTFTMYRRGDISDTHNSDQYTGPDEPQFWGVIFPDGSCALRWATEIHCTSVWASFEDAMKIHGHPEERYGSEIVWDRRDDVPAAQSDAPLAFFERPPRFELTNTRLISVDEYLVALYERTVPLGEGPAITETEDRVGSCDHPYFIGEQCVVCHADHATIDLGLDT
jgi:hypothetical protein